MIVTLGTERIRTLDDIRALLGGNVAADITPFNDREAAYAFIERTPVRFRYHFGLSRTGKGLIRKYLAKVTGYSDAQLTGLITQERHTGRYPRPPVASSVAAVSHGLHDHRRVAAGGGGRGRRPAPRERRRRGSCGANTMSSATSASSAWRGSRTATSTTCGAAGRTGEPAPHTGRPGAHRRRSASGADRGRKAVRASCASTPSTAACAMEKRGPTSSTWSTK